MFFMWIQFFILLNVFSIFIRSLKSTDITSTTGSSGKYYTLQSYQNIICNDSILCHFYGNSVSDIRITANAPTVKFECYGCNSPVIYAPNVENVIMKYNESTNGLFHFENATNIDIIANHVSDIIIYGQNAENVTVWVDYIYLTTFYFNYVSKQINFVYFANTLETTIIADHASIINISYPRLNDLDNTAIYCPYQNDTVCNFIFIGNVFYGGYSYKFDIYIANTQLGVIPIYFNTNGPKRYNILCNENENGIYQSFTTIHNHKCDNITSECCIFTNSRTDIICENDKHNVCVINCTDNTTCADGNIYATNTTNELRVVCSGYNCYDTIVNCPTTLNSLCDVSCDKYSSCYRTVIKYNNNNRHITLNCTGRWSCEYLSIFVHKIDNNTALMTGVNILCDNYSCHYLNILINVEMSYNYVTIDCVGISSCKYMSIHAETTRNVTINCITDGSCWRNQIYNQIESSCSNIHIGDSCNKDNSFQYLTSNGTSNKCTCSKAEFFCCPFSNVYKKIYNCVDNNDCYIDLDDNIYKGIIIYANKANLLSVKCTKCSHVNIFATNASKVEIICKEDCHDINLNGVYVNQFYFECDNNGQADGCKNLVFDVSYAENVVIEAKFITRSQIYASNAGNLSFICHNDCSYINLMVPSETYIECGNDDGCRNIFFYSYNKWESIKNVNIFTCDSLNWTDDHKWYLYSPSIVQISNHKWSHQISDDKCIWNARSQQTFCQYDVVNIYRSLHDKHIRNIPIDFIYNDDPFSIDCLPVINQSMFQLYQTIFGIMFCIVSLCIIIFWLIYSINQIYIKYFNILKYYQITEIEPPSQKLLLYLHCSDILIWISQIYILIIVWTLYEYYEHNICSFDELVCLSYFVCSFEDDNCMSKPLIYNIWIAMLLMLVLSAFIDILRVCTMQSDTIIATHSMLVRAKFGFDWDRIVEQFYWKRRFFRASFECVGCDHCFWDILTLISRYFMFFTGALVYYFLFNDINFHLEWYDIFPILCVLVINEIIKMRYKYLPPYDESKHIRYCINQIYPKVIASIIWEFMSNDRIENDRKDETQVITDGNWMHNFTEIVDLMEIESSTN